MLKAVMALLEQHSNNKQVMNLFAKHMKTAVA
jgi:hypothetical protein